MMWGWLRGESKRKREEKTLKDQERREGRSIRQLDRDLAQLDKQIEERKLYAKRHAQKNDLTSSKGEARQVQQLQRRRNQMMREREWHTSQQLQTGHQRHNLQAQERMRSTTSSMNRQLRMNTPHQVQRDVSEYQKAQDSLSTVNDAIGEAFEDAMGGEDVDASEEHVQQLLDEIGVEATVGASAAQAPRRQQASVHTQSLQSSQAQKQQRPAQLQETEEGGPEIQAPAPPTSQQKEDDDLSGRLDSLRKGRGGESSNSTK
jgi:hypothetical protein